MKDKMGAMGSKGMICLIANQILVKLFIGQARLMAKWVGNCAWMLYLGGILLQLAVFFITAYFYKNSPQSDPLDLAEDTFGSVGRVVIGLLFFVFFLFSFAVLFRLYAEAIKIVLFDESPIWIVVFMLLICVGISSHAGLSPLSDMHSIFVPIVFVLVIGICVLNVPNLELCNIFPIFGNGLDDIGMRLPSAMGAMSEISMLYFFLPFAKREAFPKKVGVVSLLLGSGFAFVGILVYCLAVDYPESTEYLLSMYQLSRLVHIGIALNRLEDITELFWVIVVLLALGAKIWIASHILRKTFRLPDNKPLTWSVAFLGVGIGFIPLSINQVLLVYQSYFINTIRWEIVFLPLIVALCYQIKQKIKGKQVCEKG